MLCDAEDSLNHGRIGYVFVGTHSQALHYQCKSYLEQRGYITIAHADFDYGNILKNREEIFRLCRALGEGQAPLDRWIDKQEAVAHKYIYSMDSKCSERICKFIMDRIKAVSASKRVAEKVRR